MEASASIREMSMAQTMVEVVDNDPGVLKPVPPLLRAHGFFVEPYKSAEVFLQDCAGKDLACLVLDIHLEGMSGIDLRRRLVASDYAPPVIFMTAFDDAVTHQEATAAGCVAYLLKPFAASSLIEAINKVAV